MSLPGWMGRLAQPCLPRGGKRRQVRPCLEVLEDRLTPSGDVLALTTSPQSLGSSELSHAITVQLQDDRGKVVTALNTLNFNPSSNPQYGAFTAKVSSVNGAGNSATQQEMAVQLMDDLGNLMTALSSLLVQGIGPSGSGPAGSSSASVAIASSWGGTQTLSATQQEIIQGLSSLVLTTSPLTLTAGQKSQPVTLQLEDINGRLAVASSDGPIIYLSSNASSPVGSSTMEFIDANSGHCTMCYLGGTFTI
jgi:hypothetical protein